VSRLAVNTPLGGYALEKADFALKEVSGFEIVSLAIADGTKLKGMAPSPGTWITAQKGKLLWTGQNQYFLFREGFDPDLDRTLAEKLGDNVYCTLQTDGWAALEVSGGRVHDVLERFIPLDLRSADNGFGSRTSAHHMAIIVMKMSPDSYWLLTPRSSSGSFIEALEGVVSNIFA